MCSKRAVLSTALMLFVACGPAAVGQSADPGFAYVDTNNDGLYSQSAGDIALGTDLSQITQGTGKFDVQVSRGSYRAPWRPASLIVPASVSLATDGPLELRAGGNIVVHGAINAPTIYLQAGSAKDRSADVAAFDGIQCTPSPRPMVGFIDLTDAKLNVVGPLVASAGGDVTYSHARIVGSDVYDPTAPVQSAFKVYSGSDIVGIGASVAVASILLQPGVTKAQGTCPPREWGCSTAGAGVFCYQPQPAPKCGGSGGDIDITSSDSTILTGMTLNAGGDATIDGATVTGMDFFYGPPYVSVLSITAGGDINGGDDPQTQYGLAVAIGHGYRFEAGGDVKIADHGTGLRSALSVMDRAPIASISADSDLTIGDTDLFANYDSTPGAPASGIALTAGCGKTQLLGISATAGALAIDSDGDVTVDGSPLSGAYMYLQGSFGAQSGGRVKVAPGTAVTSTGFSADGRCGVDAGGALLSAGSGAVTLSSCYGSVGLASAQITAGGGLSASAGCDTDATGAFIRADGYVKLLAGRCLKADTSDIQFFYTAVASAYIKAQAGYGKLTAANASWGAPGSISLKSMWFDVLAPSATFAAPQTQVYAGGGDIDLSNAHITGAYTLGPNGVRVTGPIANP